MGPRTRTPSRLSPRFGGGSFFCALGTAAEAGGESGWCTQPIFTFTINRPLEVNMSTKFHITKAGRTEPCGATVKACPLGEANHYGSLQEAVQASIAGVTPAAPAEKKQTPAQAWKEWHYGEGRGGTKVPADQRDLLFKGLLKSMDRDMRGAGIEGFMSDGGIDLVGLSDSEFAQLREAHTKPIRLTPSEKRDIETRLSALGVTQQEVEDYADGRIVNVPKWRGQPHYFHPSRHIAAKSPAFFAGIGSISQSYEAVAREYLADKAESARNPNHRYGSYAKKVELPTPRGGSGPKELDPQMIEALKLKYLNKFKQPFDESGLSIPELLQMAREGQLD